PAEADRNSARRADAAHQRKPLLLQEGHILVEGHVLILGREVLVDARVVLEVAEQDPRARREDPGLLLFVVPAAQPRIDAVAVFDQALLELRECAPEQDRLVVGAIDVAQSIHEQRRALAWPRSAAEANLERRVSQEVELGPVMRAPFWAGDGQG